MKLSPFGNLFFLIIAHTPHSFAQRTLHKRTQLRGVGRLRDGTSTLHTPHTGLAASIPHYAPDTLNEPHTMEVDDNNFQGGPPNYLPLGVPSHHPQLSMLGSFNPNKKRKLLHNGVLHPPMMSSASAPDASYEHQTFPIDDIVIIPSFFSHTSDLEKAFGNLPLHSDIKGLIDTIINQIPEEDIRKPYDDLSCLIENTTHHALAVSEFLAKASAVKEELASRNNVIRELLLNITPVEHPSEVVTWVRSELSAFTSRRFTHAREIIEHALGSSSYLSGLYGLLGPDDLFFYEIANLLEDFCRSEKLSDKFPSHYFVSEIQFLRETFTSFLGSADNHYATLADWLPPPGSSQDFVREMAEFEAKWAGILGSPEALSRLIRNIQESDVVKSLQLDLMDPTDPAGFELALIKPYGIGRTLDHGLAGKLSSNAISVSSTLKIYPNFEPISQKASLNMALRTSIAREALRLKNTFLRDFTPNGLEALLAHLKEANNSGNTKHSEPPIVPISFLSVNQWNLLTNHFHP